MMMEPFDLRLWKDFKVSGGNSSVPAIIDQIAIDSRRIDSSHALFVALPGVHQDGHEFVEQAARAGARYALVKKGWKPKNDLSTALIFLIVDDPLSAFQQIAKAYRCQFSCKMIGITGSHGKTMVKDLLFEMMKSHHAVVASPESFNSQIGVPLSLLRIKPHHEWALIEAAISEKNEMGILADLIIPDYGLLTHVGKKHIPTLGNQGLAAEEMLKLFQFLSKEKWVLIPKDSHIKPFLSKLNFPSYFWNETDPKLPQAHFLPKKQGLLSTYQVHFPDGYIHTGTISRGFYFFLDLVHMAAKMAWLLGVSSEQISRALKGYTPEPMRTEIWKAPTGTTFINDTYCSDPQSIDQALKWFDMGTPESRKVFIFGGMRGLPQSKDFYRISQAIQRAQIELLMLVDTNAIPIEQIRSHLPDLKILTSSSYVESLDKIQTHLKSNDVVLIKGAKKESLEVLEKAFSGSTATNQCWINLAAIQANLATIRQKIPKDTQLMVMVKALAYGTDDVRIAKYLVASGIDRLGVSYVDEAITLRRSGITQKIFVINAALFEAYKVAKWNLEVGVSDAEVILALEQEAERQHKILNLHLHIDTGMCRFGCRPEHALELALMIHHSPHLCLEGVMTHFACADNSFEDSFTRHQIHCFEEVITKIEGEGITIPWKHAANSSAVLRFHLPQFNLVRIGLAIFGLYVSDETKQALDLRLALSLTSRIVGINTCKKGESISYARRYIVERDQMRIGVLPIGYFDGLHRSYSGKGYVMIHGQKAPMVGNICMDFMMVDITDIPEAGIGDPVLIFGEDEHGQYLSPENLAISGDSIIHELITCLGPRIQRIFLSEEAKTKR
jgi:Alr-MurF fusion protein